MRTTHSPVTFDLHLAIQRWRENLWQSSAFNGENLDELEMHLRDAVRDLHTHGLAEEEAFLIATRRIGRAETLGEEFGKVNPIALWQDRALWMLAGMLFLMIGRDFASALSSALMCFGSMFSSNGLTLGWIGGITQIAGSCMVVWVFWRLANGHLSWVKRFAGRLTRRLVLCIVGAVICLWLLEVTGGIFHVLYMRNLKAIATGQNFVVWGWFRSVEPLIQLLLMIVVFARLWRGKALMKMSSSGTK